MEAEDLALSLYETALERMSRGVADRRSPFHTPIFATIGLDGAPRARTVVLRGFDRPALALSIHTDVRSAKADELAREPRCTLVFYDPGARLQVRVEATATIHRGDERASAAWARSQPMSRACYAAPLGPGAPVETPPPSPPRSDDGFERFCVVACAIERLDVLSLNRDGHRRIDARWMEGCLELRWLAP